jgi:hypothetical protein
MGRIVISALVHHTGNSDAFIQSLFNLAEEDGCLKVYMASTTCQLTFL